MPADEKPTIKFATLDALPLFATDREIAVAIVGKAKAEYWVKVILPNLKGFPPIDRRHDARPVPLVKKFYERYLGVSEDFAATGASGEENWDAWKKPRGRAKPPAKD